MIPQNIIKVKTRDYRKSLMRYLWLKNLMVILIILVFTSTFVCSCNLLIPPDDPNPMPIPYQEFYYPEFNTSTNNLFFGWDKKELIAGGLRHNPDSSGIWCYNVLTDSLKMIVALRSDRPFTVSQDGELLYFSTNILSLYCVKIRNNAINILTDDTGGYNIALSPDNNYLLYNRFNWSIYLINLSNFEFRPLLSGTDTVFGTKPTWSKDNQTIVYIEAGVNLSSINISGESYETIFIGDPTLNNPSISILTDKVVFGYQNFIYLIDKNGGNHYQVVPNQGYQPSWTSDGQKIVYIAASIENKEQGSIWIVDNNGANAHQIFP
jgi:dipeptidyl aminopeptidase/acylaminoacyl peptidase